VAVAASFAGACAQSAEMQFGKQEAERIRQRTQEYAKAFNARQLDALLAIHSGETVFMPPNAPTVRGRESVGDFFKGLFGEAAGELVLESKDVGGEGELAYESGTFSMTRRPESGAMTRDRGKYMFVWRFNRPQNNWQIAYTIWSSDLPERVTLN
jgi:ketosteroid isomerase-like protein